MRKRGCYGITKRRRETVDTSKFLQVATEQPLKLTTSQLQWRWCHFVSFFMHISGAKFGEHHPNNYSLIHAFTVFKFAQLKTLSLS